MGLSLLKEHVESPEIALTETRKIYNSNDNLSAFDLMGIATLANALGDKEFAWDAIKRSANLSRSFFWIIWSSEWKEIRDLTCFKEFVREIND